ncbi:MAG: hypothetical protein ABII88_00360 [Candidatus Omnitrophota bacterium]
MEKIKFENKKFLKVMFFLGSIALFVIFCYFKAEGRSSFLCSSAMAHMQVDGLDASTILKKGINDFFSDGIAYNPDVDRRIEEDYFAQNRIYNGDFSDELAHWSTINSSNSYPKNRNLFIVSQEECVSEPYSIKICANEHPCSLFYVKNARVNIISPPGNYRAVPEAWLGVIPGEMIDFSCYYKGIGPTIYINITTRAGFMRNLKKIIIKEIAKDWQECRISVQIPKDGRAISFEIQVGSILPNSVMYLDDILISSRRLIDDKR